MAEPSRTDALAVTEDRSESARDIAAGIWAAATARRDGEDPADTRLARPIIDRALDESPASTMVLARREGRPLGFAVVMSVAPATAEVAYLGVEPRAWGRGVAGGLLTAVAEVLRARHVREAVLWVYADNAGARRAYERAGWAADGRSRRHARSGRPELCYRHTVAPHLSRAP